MTKKAKPWKEISRETIFKKFCRGVDKIVFELPDGRQEDYYIKQEDDVVLALVVTKEQKIVLSRQFRPGPGRFLSDLPGGYVNKGDSPEESMRRELLEETGYEGNIKFLADLTVEAYSTGARHCFVITDCEKVAEPQNDKNEFIEVELMSLVDFKKMLRSGEGYVDTSVGYLGLDYLGLL